MNEEWFEIAKRPPTENDLPIVYWCKELGYRAVFCDRFSVDTRWTHWARAQVPSVPSPIAKGHNPDRLTEAQVGVKDGWRLLEEEEIGERDHLIDVYQRINGKWSDTQDYGYRSDRTYRTRLPYPVPFNQKEPRLLPGVSENYASIPSSCEQQDEAAFDKWWPYPTRAQECREIFIAGRQTRRKEDQELVKALEIPKKAGCYNTVCVVESALRKLRASVGLD